LSDSISDHDPARLHRACTKPAETDPDLAKINAAWPMLPDPIKKGIMAMVRSAAPKADDAS
jgi:hypothetical protein